MPNPAQFRITFDVPHTFALEPGFIRQVHCHDFRPQSTDGVSSMTGTWRDPLTGLILLTPSFQKTSFSENFRGLDNWNKAALETQAVWTQVERANDAGGTNDTTPAGLFSFAFPESTGTLNGSLSPSGVFDENVNIALVGIVATLAAADRIEIALESKTPIAADQGFVLYHNVITDHMHRKRNWMAVTWDKYQVHFSMDGTARIFEYATRGVYTDTPKLLQDFEIAGAGDIAGKDGYFIFIPIPGYGLRILHSHTPQSLPNQVSSAKSAASRGVLIPLPTRTVNGFATIFNESRVWIALNPYCPSVIGFQEIRYSTATAGSYVDSPFDPGYKPSFLPDDVSAFVSASPLRNALLTATLRKADDSGAYDPDPAINSGDRQARVKVAMQTTDARYTPFLLGYGVKWLPVTQTRNTVPVAPKSLYRLEFTEDVNAHFEGHCVTLMETPDQRKIVERGDTTFLIEKSLDGGGTWQTVNGGFATIDGEVSARLDSGGAMYYEASWRLVGMHGRFDEMTQILENAFDGLTPGDSINLVLNACGFSFVSPLPADLTAIKIPQTPKGQNWRFAPREGDKGDVIIRDMLLLVKKQSREWRIRYDWTAQAWLIELRDYLPTDAETWTMTAFPDEISGNASYDTNTRTMLMAAGGNSLFSFSVTPPECNVVQPFGLTSTDQNGERVPGTPLVNKKSLTDPNSPDYLGRFVNARPMMGPLEDLQWINWMGRRVYDAAAHRRLRAVVSGYDYIDALTPGKHVKVRSVVQNSEGFPERGELFATMITTSQGDVPVHLWVKRRTVVLDYNRGAGEIAPSVTYALDTVWDSEM